ncbi:hypothetical protein DKG82_14740 [Salmonella enterica subsp. enterica serovar Lexington]|nr:hypothetical protein LFZ26_11665 [Salmonella enterica subsp. enterica serovar Manchester str. ST278]ASG70528.1 hypothetical protein CE137_08070 [Salmonella enterica subsp. enterica serovar Waycross]EAA0561153.1 hypothetical protein [Salmonella enterica subsp. enterica serovar Lexington]EAA7887449.1 hypothetical protein [Salmonella enterica]EAB5959703.1 hypothetical protein [Salmonella enterica subsp. enterica serovar Manchester]EAB9334760.1 hypothetical protein [Salmonella enterica subsp. e
MGPGSAQNPHVLRVRSGFCALAGPKLASTITPGGIGSYPEMMLCEEFISHINQFEGGKARPSH